MSGRTLMRVTWRDSGGNPLMAGTETVSVGFINPGFADGVMIEQNGGAPLWIPADTIVTLKPEVPE